MSLRQIPYMAFAVILYFILITLAGLSLDRLLFTVPLPSGAGMAISLSDLLIVFATLLAFFELVGTTSASSRAILSHGLQLVVFLIALLLLLLLPRFGTATFLIITLMTLINTVAGYSISILRARRDFSIDRSLE